MAYSLKAVPPHPPSPQKCPPPPLPVARPTSPLPKLAGYSCSSVRLSASARHFFVSSGVLFDNFRLVACEHNRERLLDQPGQPAMPFSSISFSLAIFSALPSASLQASFCNVSGILLYCFRLVVPEHCQGGWPHQLVQLRSHLQPHAGKPSRVCQGQHSVCHPLTVLLHDIKLSPFFLATLALCHPSTACLKATRVCQVRRCVCYVLAFSSSWDLSFTLLLATAALCHY